MGKTLNLDNWARYQKIVDLLIDLPDNCADVREIRYSSSPMPYNDCDSVGLKLRMMSTIKGKGKDAVLSALELSDSIAITAIDNVARLSFVVDNIWEERDEEILSDDWSGSL